jgi:hypothetical protein
LCVRRDPIKDRTANPVIALAFCRRRRAVGGDVAERVGIVIGGAQMPVGDAASGAFRIRVEHPDRIARFVRSGDEKAAQLAAAEHAKYGRGKDHDLFGSTPILVAIFSARFRKSSLQACTASMCEPMAPSADFKLKMGL